jgi:cell division protein FtsW (lipid II flippase)
MSETANKLLSPRKSRNLKKTERRQAVLGYKQLSSHRRMSLVFLFVWLILIAYGLMMMFSASYGISFVQSGSAMRAQSQQVGTSDLSSPIRMIWEADATKLAKKQASYMIGGALAAILFALIVPLHQRRAFCLCHLLTSHAVLCPDSLSTLFQTARKIGSQEEYRPYLC